MGVQYAKCEEKSSPLASDFAREFVARHFGQQATEMIYANAPKYQRGPSKGQPKGWVIWTKCTVGGWVRRGSYDADAQRGNGFVMRPGTHDVKIMFVHPAYANNAVTLDAGDRRGFATDPNRETDEQWAKRCGRAVLQMQGKPVPAELAEPPYVPPFNAEKFVQDVVKYFVMSVQHDGLAGNFSNPDGHETQVLRKIAGILSNPEAL
jgi:hypothetical protein